MDVATVLLFLAAACAIPAGLVLAAIVNEHHRTGPFLRRHARAFAWAAAALAAAALLLRLRDPEPSWIGMASNLAWLVAMVMLAITQRKRQEESATTATGQR